MSRFISAGTTEDSAPTDRDEAWLQAQQKIEASKQRSKTNITGGKEVEGKSLYETLQANKAAKQEAFEESIRLKNQFRSLDDDEVEFLDSVLESTRAKEAEVRKETSRELDSFRRRQEEAGKAAGAAAEGEEGEVVEVETWKAVGPRKRKKGRESGVGSVKVRRTSTVEKDVEGEVKGVLRGGERSPQPSTDLSKAEEKPLKSQAVDDVAANSEVSDQLASKTSPAPAASLGLAAYSSDEDD